jgi:photosystem II stability/assembly factor-like uncharacterized protein
LSPHLEPEEEDVSMMRLRSVGALAGAVGLLAALPAGAPASVQVGSSGWQWGNPVPQGNNLRAMSFAGASGYAAGDFGTLLHTADGGSSWAGLRSGTLTNLTDVEAIDADSLFAGGGCVARRSDDGGATFKRVAFTPVESSCREQLAAGWFVNEQTGFLALTDGTVLRTDNDGDSFAQKTPLPGTRATRGTARPTSPSSTTRPASARPPTGASSAPRTARTRGPRSAPPTARSARCSSSTRATASPSGMERCSSSPGTAARPGRRATSASRGPTCARSAAPRSPSAS